MFRLMTGVTVSSFILLSVSYILQQSVCCANSYNQVEPELEVKVCVVDSVCLSAFYLAGVCGAVGPVQRIHG